MLKINQLLQQIIEQSELKFNVTPDNRSVEVIFQNGRRQKISIDHQGEHYILTSVILRSRQVEEFGPAEILGRLWQRNREINVVAFSLDKRGQLIGRIEQLVETIDPEELAFYLKLLAQECDQFEYVLMAKIATKDPFNLASEFI